MYDIAIVEDVAFERKQLYQFITKYQEEEKIQFRVYQYADGSQLVAQYPSHLDILLMDIGMQKMDGMTAARLIRRRDKSVVLIFVSSMIHYGLQGYSVDALDFIVKPVSYTALRLRLNRAIARLRKVQTKPICFKNGDVYCQIMANDITYIETARHKVIIHTADTEYTVSMSMQAMEEELKGLPFFRCHTSFLVNLEYIDFIRGNDITVNGQVIPISRYKKKDFLDVWNAWGGEGL